ncbi:MAG: two-component regulator propeller domain-containing protein, partial [Rhodothermales bacterium]|nr:two-component regulator propeller domain-containing protein [Rhodothermales bacterium]
SGDHTKPLFEGRDGRLWVGTWSDGLNRFDPVTETFAHFRHNPEDPTSLGEGGVMAIAEDAGGTLWVGTWGGGLSRFDPATETFTRYGHDPDDPASLHHDNVYALAPDPGGGLWVGTATGIARVAPPAPGQAARTLSRVDVDVTPFGGASFVTGFALCLDRAGALWIGTYGRGLVRYEPATGAVRNYPAGPGGLGHSWVFSIMEDRAGTLWVGTYGGGLHRYDAEADAFERFAHDAADPASVAADEVQAIAEDRAGVLWVGTGRGLSRRLPLSRVVAQEQHRPGDPQSLRSDDVTAFVDDASGMLWVGTHGGGLHRRDASGAFERVPLLDAEASERDLASVRGLAADPDGTVWASTPAGVFRGRGSGPFEPFVAVDSAGAPLEIRDPGPLAVPAPGRLWVGSQFGLYDVDAASGRAMHYGPAPPKPGSNVAQMVDTLLPAPDGGAWVGVAAGLYRFDPAAETFTNIRAAIEGEEPSGNVLTLLRGQDGTLWVGTSRGLERRDADGRWRRYGRADGLPNTFINGLLEAPAGYVWAATNRGLSRLDPRTGAVLSYGAQDGLQGDISNLGAVYRSPRTGTFYVGGDHGYNAFDPAALSAEPPPGPVVLTGLRLLDAPVPIGAEGSPLERALSMTEELRLHHADRVVTFTFAALDFRAPSTHRYAVRLDGFDGDWREVGGRREATFTNLSPGRYTFRVRAAGRDGTWGNETALALTVVPPWWRTWWATIGYALLTLALLTAAYRARRRRHELRHRMELEHLEAEQLRELDRARSRFFANVSHEFRTPLTLTLGPLDDMRAGLYGPLPEPMAQQVDLARRNAGRVLNLINQILDVARLEAGRTPLRARPLDLGAFVEALAQPFRALAARKAIAFVVDLPASPVEVFADPPQLEKAVANLLSNAVKFTPEGGAVRVTVAAEGGTARVAVRDSGVGIPAADLPYVFDRFYQVNEAAQTQLGTGIGLALAKEVVELHGGALTVESEEGFGSTFTVALPLGRAHLDPDQIVGDAEPWTLGASLRQLVEDPGGDGSTPHPTGATAEPSDDAPDDDADVTTVLLVEDHPEVRAYVRRHLEAAEEGGPAYRVLEAADGEEGLAKARALLPDLVLSDVMMPKLGGLALCRALKADPETDFIPVILLTAKAEREDRLEGLRKHADDYLTKPFDMAELRARIANLIETRKRLRERFASVEGQVAMHPTAEDLTSADEAFLGAVRAAIEAGMGSEDFGVEQLAETVGFSRSQLNRKLKALLGHSSSDVLRSMRLERASQMLAARAGSVSEVAYAVGFRSVAHFSNAFLDRFGCRPSAYRGERVSEKPAG